MLLFGHCMVLLRHFQLHYMDTEYTVYQDTVLHYRICIGTATTSEKDYAEINVRNSLYILPNLYKQVT